MLSSVKSTVRKYLPMRSKRVVVVWSPNSEVFLSLSQQEVKQLTCLLEESLSTDIGYIVLTVDNGLSWQLTTLRSFYATILPSLILSETSKEHLIRTLPRRILTLR